MNILNGLIERLRQSLYDIIDYSTSSRQLDVDPAVAVAERYSDGLERRISELEIDNNDVRAELIALRDENVTLRDQLDRLLVQCQAREDMNIALVLENKELRQLNTSLTVKRQHLCNLQRDATTQWECAGDE